jgi:hypothetical protein
MFVGMAPAQAAGGSCSANQETVSHVGPDGYRVAAICFSLNAGTQARGVLDIPFAVDRHTVWFTGLRVTKRSGESTHPGTARIELEDY